METTQIDQFIAEFKLLPPQAQERVINYARTLSKPRPRGTPGHELLKFVGCIPPEDLEEIAAAIEEGCERIDYDGW